MGANLAPEVAAENYCEATIGKTRSTAEACLRDHCNNTEMMVLGNQSAFSLVAGAHQSQRCIRFLMGQWQNVVV